MNQPPSLAQLRHAWERALLAKVQLIELQSWGASTTDLLRQTTDEYDRLETAYVEAMVERRSSRAQPSPDSSAAGRS